LEHRIQPFVTNFTNPQNELAPIFVAGFHVWFFFKQIGFNGHFQIFEQSLKPMQQKSANQKIEILYLF
jgi:hypothetical protein